jgi:hypothetical protein
MFEASVEEIGLEEEGCHTVETEQERLDRDGTYGEIKRELIKRGIPAHEIAFIHDREHGKSRRGNEYAGTFGREASASRILLANSVSAA